jgi:predicted membrane-bound spermidine synthase
MADTSSTGANLRNRYLYLAVFCAGMTTLAVELSAARLLEAVFGTSNIVWANIIGLILVYLTLGYFIGGRWADRSPRLTTFYQLLTWAAFSAGLIPLVSKPILGAAARAFPGPNQLSANVALVAGSFVSVLVLFALPVTLLGCVSPFAIRLALKNVTTAGDVSGRVYAVSTLGSIVGNFTPVLLLIPTLGTARTFLIFSGLLMAVALTGLARAGGRWQVYLWMPLVLAGLAWLTLSGPVKPVEEGKQLLFEKESAYNLIQVVEDDVGWRYLLLNEGQGWHSLYHPDLLLTDFTWDYFLIGPLFNPPPFHPEQVQQVAIIGLAGGTIARQYNAVYGPSLIDGVEIDPEIVRAGREYFEMTMPNLNAVVADGRYFLVRTDSVYDVIAVDAYRLPYIPWHLTTVEFFRQARDHLDEDGVLIVNVGCTESDYRLVRAVVATLRTTFPSTHVIPVPDSFNAIVVATVQPSSIDNLALNLATVDNPLLKRVGEQALANWRPVEADGPVFTDDKAPVEQLTNLIVMRYLLRGE